MSTDDFDEPRHRAWIDVANESYRTRPPGRNEAWVIVAGEQPRRVHLDALEAECRANDLRSLARRVRKACVGTDCVLLVLVGSDVALRVVRLQELDPTPAPARSRAVGPSVHGVLGLLSNAAAGGAR